MEEKGANVRRKSEKRKPPRARRGKILNYRKWPRGPCRNSLNCANVQGVGTGPPPDTEGNTNASDIDAKPLYVEGPDAVLEAQG